MLAGLTSKLSESTVASSTTIQVRSDLVYLTGTTTIANILGQYGGGDAGVLFVVPTSGNVATATTGNILNALTMVQNQLTVLVFSKKLQKWVVGAIS